MKTIQRSGFLSHVREGVTGRYAGLSRRGRIVLGAAAFTGLAWLLGLPQSLWRHIYVWLAYPPAVLIQAISSPLNAHVRTIGWGQWTAHIDARYAWLHTRAHGDLGGVIAIEVLLPLVLLGMVAWRVGWFWYTRPRRLQPSTAHGSARWMTRQEMRSPALRYSGAPLLLGQRAGVSVSMNRALQVLNTLLIGPIGSGKTSGVILPNLLRETGARDLIISDLKLELLGKSYTHLAQAYDIWVLNFGSPETSMGYNPLTACASPLLTALWCDSWIRNHGENKSDPIWDNWTKLILMASIFHLQDADPSGATVTLAHLDEFLNAHAAEWVIKELAKSPSPRARKRARGFLQSISKNQKQLGSVWSEISPKFLLLSEPTIQATTSTHEIHLQRLGSGQGKPVALFLALDPDLIEEMRPLTASFFLDVFRSLGASARTAPGGKLARDVMVYGDEWGNIGFVPRFTTALNMLRSAGVYGVYVVQTTSQLVETYEENGFIAIKAACNTKIGLSNMVDDDATWFSQKVLGETTEVAQSASVQRGRFHVTTDRGGASQSETKRALLTPDEVMNIREDELLVKMPQRPPARLIQRRYYSDPEVSDRAPAEGESWIPPLGPARPDGPLRAPTFEDDYDTTLDEAGGVLTDEPEPSPATAAPSAHASAQAAGDPGAETGETDGGAGSVDGLISLLDGSADATLAHDEDFLLATR